LRSGFPLLIEDTQNSPFVPEADRAAVAGLGLIACLSVPLIKDTTLVGALVIGSRTRRRWTAIETDIVRETAERLWAAVERARAELALRESEERFRSLFESMSQGYGYAELIRDGGGTVVDLRVLDVNPAFERLRVPRIVTSHTVQHCRSNDATSCYVF
jgi:GAF domain-containing protein